MAYNILYKASVQRDLKRLSKAEAKRVLDRLERELPKKADAQPALTGRFAGLRKYRVGDYRVIYAIIGQDVVVLRMTHRKDAYRRGL